jgi:Ca2+-binding EF-hand superfamily protein
MTCTNFWVCQYLTICYLILGEKLADEEVGELLNGHEDSQGNVNYEEFVRAVMSG